MSNVNGGYFLGVFALVCIAILLVMIYRTAKSGGYGSVPSRPGLPGGEIVGIEIPGSAYINGARASLLANTVLVINESVAEVRTSYTHVRFTRDEVVGLKWNRGIIRRGIHFQTASGRLDNLYFTPSSERRAMNELKRLGWF